MLRHLRQWSKNFGFGSALSHNSGATNTILFTIQTFNEHSRMAKLSQPYLRGHMRWNVTSLQVQLGLIGTYNFGRLSTLKSNILSTRKLRVLWPILWHISLTSTWLGYLNSNLMLSWVSPFNSRYRFFLCQEAFTSTIRDAVLGMKTIGIGPNCCTVLQPFLRFTFNRFLGSLPGVQASFILIFKKNSKTSLLPVLKRQPTHYDVG